MSFSTPELSLGEMIAVAERYGYDGLEPRLDAGHAHGVEVSATPEQRAEIREAFAAAGVDLACLATSLTYADPAQSEGVIRQTHQRIDLAGDVGAPRLRVFGGRIPPGVGRERAIAELVDSLGTVAQHAAQRDVTLCLETHDDWCDPRHVVAVMERVDRPAVGVNWDVMHPVRMGYATVDESFDMLQPWIRHLHVHDGVGGEEVRFAPMGEGVYNHRRALKVLVATGYTGFISGEWINWEPYDVHLPREIAKLRQYEEDLRSGDGS